MFIASVIIILLIYRSYLFYKKRNDRKTLAESQRIYLHGFFPKHFSYYNQLNTEEQQEFIDRTIHIRDTLTFKSSHDLLISENIKTLISAAFTQITFGFDKFYLDHFHTIFLHPSAFYSRFIDREVKGLTFANGMIHWSWDDFVKGYMFSDDKLNLALHELAHAIQIACFENKEVDTPDYAAWQVLAEIEIAHMQANPDHAYFRAYAASNIHEFFAVTVEYFFEDPKQFRAKLPSLYEATCKVLMQDMALRVERKLIAG
ncbi:MAG: zinc-dependent peptidase [Bacteroidetes bacterium]|nr:zinc-dependent peptidase [Bacteroidota bacterium]